MNRSNTTTNSIDPVFLKATDPLSERAARAMRPNARPVGLVKKPIRNVITLQNFIPDRTPQVILRPQEGNEPGSFGKSVAENDDAR